MVNFKDLIRNNGKPTPIEPRVLFQSLRRDKKFEYLRDVQGDVLDGWFPRRDDRDLIIKMNTGSGKTLVGLLILWSRLKEGKGPALYLCPDNYLVSQVKREADQLGISYTEFEETNEIPLEFSNSSAILITNAYKLFNGLSVFGVGDSPDFVKVGSMLVDDAHTCINIARRQFTATFNRETVVGKRIYSLFAESLRQQSVGMASDLDSGSRRAIMRIPYWTWQENLATVARLLSDHRDDDELKFVWPFLREGQILRDCVCIISGDRIEVSPALIPIKLIPSFHNTGSRAYMSATMVDDAAVIRQFSVGKEAVLRPIRPKVSGDIGERMVIAPSLVDSTIEETTIVDLVDAIRNHHHINVVILVPSGRRAQLWTSQGAILVTRDNISEVMAKLSASTGNIAVFVNRYDGIDLPEEACRVLIFDGLPIEPELRMRLEASERQGSPILRREIIQRIEQGLGRGVRSRSDHCVVILMRNELVSFLFKVENQQFLTGETRAQISLGQRLANSLKEQSVNSYQAIINVIEQCLARDQDWQNLHDSEVQQAGITPPSESAVSIASAELEAWNMAISGQHERSRETIARLINQQDTLQEIDKGWYLQLEAMYLHRVDRSAATEKQLKAYELNHRLLRPPAGVSYRKIAARHGQQAASVSEWIRSFTEPNALVVEANRILDQLSFGIDNEAFENALVELCAVLGFQGQRPEKQTGQGPDVLWIMPDDHYLVVEAKSRIKEGRDRIYKVDAEQLAMADLWFKNTYSNKSWTPVTVHPASILAKGAYVPEGSKVIQENILAELVASVKEFVASLATKPGDQWSTPQISETISAHSLTPGAFRERFLKRIEFEA